MEHRSALVTGSTGGIGAAIAAALATVGAHVVVSRRDTDRGNLVVESIRRYGGRADLVATDLAGGYPAIRELADAER